MHRVSPDLQRLGKTGLVAVSLIFALFSLSQRQAARVGPIPCKGSATTSGSVTLVDFIDIYGFLPSQE